MRHMVAFVCLGELALIPTMAIQAVFLTLIPLPLSSFLVSSPRSLAFSFCHYQQSRLGRSKGWHLQHLYFHWAGLVQSRWPSGTGYFPRNPMANHTSGNMREGGQNEPQCAGPWWNSLLITHLLGDVTVRVHESGSSRSCARLSPFWVTIMKQSQDCCLRAAREQRCLPWSWTNCRHLPIIKLSEHL